MSYDTTEKVNHGNSGYEPTEVNRQGAAGYEETEVNRGSASGYGATEVNRESVSGYDATEVNVKDASGYNTTELNRETISGPGKIDHVGDTYRPFDLAKLNWRAFAGEKSLPKANKILGQSTSFIARDGKTYIIKDFTDHSSGGQSYIVPCEAESKKECIL